MSSGLDEKRGGIKRRATTIEKELPSPLGFGKEGNPRQKKGGKGPLSVTTQIGRRVGRRATARKKGNAERSRKEGSSLIPGLREGESEEYSKGGKGSGGVLEPKKEEKRI